jgi:hypothetical protein
VTVNIDEPEVPPPGVELTMVTDEVPTEVTSPEGIVAWRDDDETKVVVMPTPFQSIVDSLFTKLAPVAVSVKAELPAAVDVGLMEVRVGTALIMVKVADPEVPPPGVALVTVMGTVPPVVMLEEAIVVVSDDDETNVVAAAPPFQLMVDAPFTKLVPLTVSVKFPPPVVVDVGLMELRVGAGLRIVKFADPEVPTPGLVTVIGTVAPTATLEEAIVVVSDDDETNVVVRAPPFQLMTELLTKFHPVAVSVKAELPAAVDVGLMEVRVGPATRDPSVISPPML